jgi:amino acid adenylation domain-containing protein/thioester reductase-like protein
VVRVTASSRSVVRTDDAPLSFAQERLWLVEQMQPGTPLHNLAMAVSLEGPLDAACFEEAVKWVAARHAAFRTTLPIVAGRPVQRVADEVELALPYVADPASGDAGGVELDELIQAEVRRPFDLAHGPLVRALLARRSAEHHIFLLVTHHVVIDGSSISLVFEELVSAYERLVQGRTPTAPLPSFDYPEFARSQREEGRRGAFARDLDYWRTRLEGVPPLDFPTDRRRPAQRSVFGSLREFRLGSSLRESLRSVCRELRLTAFMVALAAFEILLARHAGQEDFAVGLPVAGRTRSETQRIVGFFVNTLALRSDVRYSRTVRELLGEVRRSVVVALGHQELPFQMLVEELRPQRHLGRSPLFDVMFTFQGDPFTAIRARETRFGTGADRGLRVNPSSVCGPTGTSKFDLTLNLTDTGDGLLGSVEYSTDLFDESTIDRLIKRYRLLLARLPYCLELPVSKLLILPEEERRQVVVQWNETTRPLRRRCVHELFEEQAARTPDAPAVLSPEETVSYAALNARANRLARVLRARGLRAEALVGIHVARPASFLVAALGIWKAGGAYVPLDPDYPRERLRFMLADSRAGFVVADDASLDLRSEAETILLGADGEPQAPPPAAELEPWVTSANLAYVIYTSGSTGRPKGVAVTHEAATNYLQYAADAYGGAGPRGALVHSSPSFDLTVTSLFAPLLTGAAAVFLPANAPPEQLADAIAESAEPLSLLKLTPAHLTLLVEELERRGASAACRTLVVGGESLAPVLVGRWLAHAPGSAVVNEYGPTEATVGCCAFVTKTSPPHSWMSVPIGRPTVNASLYVLDADLEPVPIGVTGELFIGGAQVARGYFGRPGLTAERFLPDPFSREPGTRLYRTGDLGRWLEDGNLEFLGRSDDQVKISGFRVELGEIEAALVAHPAVAEAAVTLERRGDVAVLPAYVVWQAGAQGSSHEHISAFLRERLPRHMVPSSYTTLPRLPRNRNGKVKRAALAATAADGALLRRVPTERVRPPSTATERAIAELWREVLQLDQVDRDASFFEVGGHSLLALELASGIRERLHVDVSLTTIFEHPSVAALAAHVDQVRQAQLEWWEDVRLDPWIRPRRGAPSADHDVFLTGATGFVGTFLLHELLERRPERVRCLVRAETGAEGRDRIEAVLRRYGLWRERYRARIEVVTGDLGQPESLRDDLDTLAPEIGSVYHCGACTDARASFEEFWSVNVGGTAEMLRLAAQSGARVNHISSVSVIPPDRLRSGRSVGEDEALDPHSLVGSYPRSKWAAEQLVLQGGARGIAGAVYRLPRVTGERSSGRWNDQDSMARALQEWIRSGRLPIRFTSEIWAPVDWIAETVVSLSLKEGIDGHVFHLTEAERIDPSTLFAVIADLGFEVECAKVERDNSPASLDTTNLRLLLPELTPARVGRDLLQAYVGGLAGAATSA